jgi:replicative DNA helicase
MQDYLKRRRPVPTPFCPNRTTSRRKKPCWGSILINPESYFDVAQIWSPTAFTSSATAGFGSIYVPAREPHSHRHPDVSEELENRSKLEEIGGQAYMMMLINQTPSSLNAGLMRRSWKRRLYGGVMLASANDMAKLAYQEEKPIDDIINSAEKSIFDISERRIRRDLQPIQNVII